MNKIFTAVVAGGIMLALVGLVSIDKLIIVMAVGAAGKKFGHID